MNNAQLIITAGLLALLLLVNQLAGGGDACAHCYGALPWYGWGIGFVALLIAGLVYARRRNARAHQLLARRQPPPSSPIPTTPETELRWNEELRRKYDSDGPDFPHPVIVAERCIGCHACVESCPHDVLAISYTEDRQPVASVVDPDLCLEDTSCEAVCPVNPKACLVINTAKQIKSVPKPNRDSKTYECRNVTGCYVIGDVSGTPLIKNAANEGAAVVAHLADELRAAGVRGAPPALDCDVAIIGAGPAGLSAAVTAQRLGLTYLCLEQNTVMSTIANYSQGKYVFFKPETTEPRGGIPVDGAGALREAILEMWKGTMRQHSVTVNENESCKSVKKAEDGDYFVVVTEREKGQADGHDAAAAGVGVGGGGSGGGGGGVALTTYLARRVVLAIGNSSSPLKLKVGGNEVDIMVAHGDALKQKVRYRLPDPQAFAKLKLIVVGGGNSAVEAAVDLVTWRREDGQIDFRPAERQNEVTMLVRGADFKTDVKFGNKQQLYRCLDRGLITLRRQREIVEVRADEVVTMNLVTGKIDAPLKNHFIFALIGSQRPAALLTQIKVEMIE